MVLVLPSVTTEGATALEISIGLLQIVASAVPPPLSLLGQCVNTRHRAMKKNVTRLLGLEFSVFVPSQATMCEASVLAHFSRVHLDGLAQDKDIVGRCPELSEVFVRYCLVGVGSVSCSQLLFPGLTLLSIRTWQ